jgi:hypothetical protein
MVSRGRAYCDSATDHCEQSDVEGTHVSAVPCTVRMFDAKDRTRYLRGAKEECKAKLKTENLEGGKTG